MVGWLAAALAACVGFGSAHTWRAGGGHTAKMRKLSRRRSIYTWCAGRKKMPPGKRWWASSRVEEYWRTTTTSFGNVVGEGQTFEVDSARWKVGVRWNWGWWIPKGLGSAGGWCGGAWVSMSKWYSLGNINTMCFLSTEWTRISVLWDVYYEYYWGNCAYLDFYGVCKE